MRALKIIVLAKQVPDTHNVGKDAMKADGTVNRAALPAIFNPEDLSALEPSYPIKREISKYNYYFINDGTSPSCRNNSGSYIQRVQIMDI